MNEDEYRGFGEQEENKASETEEMNGTAEAPEMTETPETEASDTAEAFEASEAAGLTPEEEAEKAIEEARTTGEEWDAEEEARRRWEKVEAVKRAEEEQRQEQERMAEEIRRENAAREEAARAEKKARKKIGLRLTAAVLAVVLLVCSAGYAAGELSKTIKSLKNQVSSLEAQNENNSNRSASDKLPDGSALPEGGTLPDGSTLPDMPNGQYPGNFDSNQGGNFAPGGEGQQPGQEQSRESREAEAPVTKADDNDKAELAHDGSPVVSTAAVSEAGSSSLTDVSDIVENTLPSIVSIVVTIVKSYDSYWGGGGRTYEVPGAGSGIIIGDDGTELWIVTNYHVIEDSKDIEITFCDDESVEAYIKGTDKDNDLAVLGVQMDNMKQSTLDSIKVITIGESDSLKLGQGVIAIGNALGWGQSVTTGVVSALNREVEFDDGTKMNLLQTSAAINPGNSGGALLNSKGELIGINNSKYADTDVEGIGFAIPISSVKEIMQQLSLTQVRTPVAEKDYPYLGVTFKNLSAGYMEATGIPSGAYIYEVGTDTPAEKAGLLPYDVITGINGASIGSYDDLVEELQYYSGGTEVELTVMRLERGAYQEVKVMITLGYRSDYQR